MAQKFDTYQLLGKTLFAKVDVPIYSNGTMSTPFKIIKAGNRVGQIYSFGMENGNVVWQLAKNENFGQSNKPSYKMVNGKVVLQYTTDAKGKKHVVMSNDRFPVYVIHNDKYFDLNALKEQGAKTVEQIQEAKEEDDKSFLDKALDTGKTIGIGLVVTGLLVGAGYLAMQSKKVQQFRNN